MRITRAGNFHFNFFDFCAHFFLFILSFSNTLLCLALALSMSGRFSMTFRIFLNVLPCSGFMKKSASIFVIGQYATLTSPF